MQYSKLDMFFDDEVITAGASKTSTVLDNLYNRNAQNKMCIAVHCKTDVEVASIALQTSQDNSTWTTLRTWANVTPDKNGYLVMERLPKGYGRYLRMTVTNGDDGEAKILAAITLEEDSDYNIADSDPVARFNGTEPPKTIAETNV